MTRRSAPPLSRCVANVWRSPCGPMRTGTSAAFRYLSTTRALPYQCLLRAVFFERLQRDCADRHDPFFRAFPHHSNDAESKVNVAPVESDGFAHADTGRIKRLQNRAVAKRENPLALDAAEQAKDVVDRKKNRQRLFLLRRREERQRVARYALLAQKIT